MVSTQILRILPRLTCALVMIGLAYSFSTLGHADINVDEADMIRLRRALAKQVQIETHLAASVHYKSDLWSAEFIAHYDPSSEEVWKIVKPESLTEEQTMFALDRLSQDEIANFGLILEDDDIAKLEDLRLEMHDNLFVYDFAITLSVDNNGRVIKNRLRASVSIDPELELVKHVHVYNTKGFRISSGARVRTFSLTSEYDVLPGIDAAVLKKRSQTIKGRTALVIQWEQDYTAEYSEHAYLAKKE